MTSVLPSFTAAITSGLPVSKASLKAPLFASGTLDNGPGVLVKSLCNTLLTAPVVNPTFSVGGLKFVCSSLSTPPLVNPIFSVPNGFVGCDG